MVSQNGVRCGWRSLTGRGVVLRRCRRPVRREAAALVTRERGREKGTHCLAPAVEDEMAPLLPCLADSAHPTLSPKKRLMRMRIQSQILTKFHVGKFAGNMNTRLSSLTHSPSLSFSAVLGLLVSLPWRRSSFSWKQSSWRPTLNRTSSSVVNRIVYTNTQTTNQYTHTHTVSLNSDLSRGFSFSENSSTAPDCEGVKV